MGGCYCEGASSSKFEGKFVQPLALPSAPIRRGIAISIVAHVVLAIVGSVTIDPEPRKELVDIELAPPPPPVEALPAEQKRTPEEARAAEAAEQARANAAAEPPPPADPAAYAVDAGVDAPIDAAPIDAAPPDARPRRPRPDAAIDAGEPMVATVDDAGTPDGGEVATVVDDASTVSPDGGEVAVVADAGSTPSDGGEVATGSGSGVGSSAGSGSLADENTGSGSASRPGTTDEVAVDGAPTTAGTAANLLAYFPRGHKVTVLMRFDRLRGTDWMAPTERLFKPMPDYRRLFGGADARIAEKLDMLVISTPEPANAIATTLVAKTKLDRPTLRTFLQTAGPVVWSAAKGGLVGKRGGANLLPGDKRVFLSPFRGWFLLAHPADLPNLLAPATGNVDAIEASAKLPAWLHGIRKIEDESGLEARGPALVMTMDLGGKRFTLPPGGDFGLGISSFPMPERISVAAEIVKQGWLVRGNLRFATARDAAEFVKTALAVKQRIDDSTALQLAIGKPISRIIKNLSFATAGERASYATSVSISDMQAVLAVATQLVDAHFAAAVSQP